MAASSAARAQIALLPDGRRLHLQDGPIDLVIEAFGSREAIAEAYRAASRRFIGLLDELCAQLPDLRRPVAPDAPGLQGRVAARMFDAVHPFCGQNFITPMAAVAGGVADEILAAMMAATGGRLTRACVNNGGDIALCLSAGTQFVAGLIDRPDQPNLFAKATIHAGDGVGGLATSGAHGRSFSLGIADAVTILARNGAAADAAATIVANAVDLPGHPGIVRVPAASLQPDSDLGNIAVTRAVPALSADEIDAALASGVAVAQALTDDDLIVAAALHLQGRTRFVGGMLSSALPQYDVHAVDGRFGAHANSSNRVMRGPRIKSGDDPRIHAPIASGWPAQGVCQDARLTTGFARP